MAAHRRHSLYRSPWDSGNQGSHQRRNQDSSHAAVRSVAVVGIPDEQWGERPLALVVCKEGEDLEPQAIATHLQGFVDRGHITKWAIPRQIRIVPDIPKTSVGKINKRLIRELEASNGKDII
ncbi:MAG: hypothetical protein E6Z80_22470 [Citrobacter freundii]|nr:hypothetical protein [Citrobacter freundii]